MEPIIRNITDTARWVAVYRADESERTDAIFHDPFARMLAGTHGENIVQAMEHGRKNSWSFVARTYLFDKLILNHIKNNFTLILNLASGLDARPFRLDLPKELCWIDVDLPEMNTYINEKMTAQKPRCNQERISIDLSNREERLVLFDNINQRNKKTLILAEGLVGYLKDDEVGALAFDLSHFKNFRHWALDLMSPGILPLINEEMGTLLEDARTPLIFGPSEGEDFFQLFGWNAIASYSKLKTAGYLNRLPKEMHQFASQPEPEGPKGDFPWSGVCLFENRL